MWQAQGHSSTQEPLIPLEETIRTTLRDLGPNSKLAPRNQHRKGLQPQCLGSCCGSNILSKGSRKQAWSIFCKTCSCLARSFSAKSNHMVACSHGDQTKSGSWIRAAPPQVWSPPLCSALGPQFPHQDLSPRSSCLPSPCWITREFQYITQSYPIHLALMHNKPPQNVTAEHNIHFWLLTGLWIREQFAGLDWGPWCIGTQLEVC